MPVDAKITSLRKVDWGSMRANFFVIYPVDELPDVPVTYMTAFKAPEQKGFDNALVREFPNITSVDVSATLAQIQGVLDQVVRAVEFLFMFTLAAGLVVLFAAITATREERAREFAVMRAVGAQARLLRQVQRAELAGVGMLAGLLAALVATRRGLGPGPLCLQFRLDRLAAGAARRCIGRCGAGLLAGWWGLRDVLRRPVVETLRRAPQCGASVAVQEPFRARSLDRRRARAALTERFDLMAEPLCAARWQRSGKPPRCSVGGWRAAVYTERFGTRGARHMPFAIGITERDQWLACMDRWETGVSAAHGCRAFPDRRLDANQGLSARSAFSGAGAHPRRLSKPRQAITPSTAASMNSQALSPAPGTYPWRPSPGTGPCPGRAQTRRAPRSA